MRSFNQDVVDGGFSFFHCKRIRLRAMREAKATTSDWTLVRLAGIGDTPKIAIIGVGCSVY